MSDFILTKYDVSGIQNYIFATNRLQENMGASYNVTRVLNEFLPDALDAALHEADNSMQGKDPCKSIIIKEWTTKNNDGQLQPLSIKKNPDIAAEVVYIGGGNAMVIYRSRELCRITDQLFAQRVTEACHGIMVFAAHICTRMENFSEDRKNLEDRLAAIKRKTPRELMLSRYPIVEQDPVYGLPVTECWTDKEGKQPVSVVQYEKKAAYDLYREKCLKRTNIYDMGFSYPVQVEQLVKKRGEDGYLAVVHIDGNGMGDFVSRKLNEKANYDEAVKNMRYISSAISNVYDSTYNKLIETVCSLWNEKDGWKDDEGKKIIPFRPLINDGDDITFLCSPALALPFTVSFLRELMKYPDKELPLSACAGIAFVHSHFPFKIAYELAEECCGQAKKKWYKDKLASQGYLDFYLVRGAYIKGMEEQRDEKDIRIRPFCVGEKAQKDRTDSIDSFLETCRKMSGNEGENSQWPRSRLKRMYETYLSEPKNLKYLEMEFASRGIKISDLLETTSETASESPAVTGACGIFDALEVFDFYDKDITDSFLK